MVIDDIVSKNGTAYNLCVKKTIMAKYIDALLKNTLKEIMTTQDLDDLTVKDLCGKAGINRKTFYNHFTGMSDLVSSMILEQFRNMAEGASGPDIWDQTTRAIMQRMRDDYSFLHAVYVSTYYPDVQKKLKDEMNRCSREFVNAAVRYLSDTEKKTFLLNEPYDTYLVMFYSALMFSMLENWFSMGMKESIDDIVQIIADLTDGTVYNGVRKYGGSSLKNVGKWSK